MQVRTGQTYERQPSTTQNEVHASEEPKPEVIMQLLMSNDRTFIQEWKVQSFKSRLFSKQDIKYIFIFFKTKMSQDSAEHLTAN